MMDTTNWIVMFCSGVFNVVCLRLVPYLYRSVLPHPHKETYMELEARKKFDFDGRLPKTLLGLIALCLTGWTFLADSTLNQHNLVGSSKFGNATFAITIGQFLSDILYEVVVYRHLPKLIELIHHGACIIGSLMALKYYHSFSLARNIHHLILPTVMVYAQMHTIKMNVDSKFFKTVTELNWIVYAISRLLVIPFVWCWMLVTFANAPDRDQMPLYMTVAFFPGTALLDAVNIWYGYKLTRLYLSLKKKHWKHAD